MKTQELGIGALLAAYRAGSLDPRRTVAALLARDAAVADPAIWIVPPDREALERQAAALTALPAAERAALPLYGVPFAVKDNIDVAGLPTTAGCPGFAYAPARTAPVVERLLAAGAILVGKTNLDQFATGLVGVRSPYGAPRNAVDARYVPGGSSSGSAVAVAQGIVPFALGTDTAGSGRVPAGFNGIVGLKPSRGLLSCEGVVPACRSLDCVSIFARSAGDAARAFAVARGESAGDPYARGHIPRPLPGWRGLRAGVPAKPEFFGDEGCAAAFNQALARAVALGAAVTAVDFAPFAEVAAMLYEGPWLAERYAAVGAFVDANPHSVLDVTRGIIAAGRAPTAADLFAASYRLEALRRQTAALWAEIDVLMVPTAPTIPTLDELAADPLGPNRRLGTYTNFVNLLDMAGIAVPAGRRDDAMPFGVTLLGPAMTDDALLDLGAAWDGLVELAVVGAHLQGQPLHGELDGAPLLGRTRTAAAYRLYALKGTTPPKPGLVRVAAGGAAIEVEVYGLTRASFGRFVAGVPAPLAIGTVTLADGRAVKGFVCEPAALDAATDITAYGGWRAYRAASA